MMFWMICRKPAHAGSETKPQKRYTSRDAAAAEAKRLAQQTGARYLILAPVEEIRPGDETQEALL